MQSRSSGWLNLKNAVEPIKIQFALSLSKGVRGFDRLTQLVEMWKPLMARQALGNCSCVALPPASMQSTTNGFHTHQLIF